MTNVIDELEAEYCPPLDPTVFRAIVSDFDLSIAADLDGAREILAQLKQATIADQVQVDASGWDPSGTGGAESESTNGATASNDYEISNLTTDVQGLLSNGSIISRNTGPDALSSTLSLTPSVESLHMATDNALTEDQQVQRLQEIFPDLTLYTVQHKLRTCGGNWSRAFDELLNLTFLNGQEGNEKISAKGIDAFSEQQTSHSNAKKSGKGKRKNRIPNNAADNVMSSSPATVTASSAPVANAWLRSEDEICMISEKMQIPSPSARSIYHQNQMSMQQTILAILNSQATRDRTSKVADDSHVQIGSVALREEYPNLSLEHAIALVAITHPLIADARHLAKLACGLTQASRSNSGGLTVIPGYAPLRVDAVDQPVSESNVAQKKARRPVNASAEDNAAMAAAWSSKANERFQQASAAHRKGKSNHLMGAAAGYYAQEGHDAARRAREYSGHDADSVVARNSTSNYIDLHYITVKDAVRIAKSRTEDWWRLRKGVRGIDGRIGEVNSSNDHLTIVTGRGAHSAGGVGRIGPSVSTMLIREGWNISHNEGHIHVNGKGRK